MHHITSLTGDVLADYRAHTTEIYVQDETKAADYKAGPLKFSDLPSQSTSQQFLRHAAVAKDYVSLMLKWPG